MCLLHLPTILSLLAFTTALPSPLHSPQKPLPLLIWHGLGDRYDAEGLQSTGDLAQDVHPGTFVYYVRTDDDGSNDRTNTFFGNVTTQIAQVCEDIRHEPRFLAADGKTSRVDALGFSQGGQFLRGLVERCEGLSVRSLVTFGSQHNGIAEFQTCGDWDFLCKGATALVKGNAWTEYVQNKVVPAQYYRTVNETSGLASEEYLTASNFLADVNNEREEKNAVYKERIERLEKFVMFVFEDDETVIPKETGWFAEVNRSSGVVTPLRERLMYVEDWVGLKGLDEKGGLVFRTAEGGHMQLDEEVLRETFGEFFGPEKEEEEEEEDDGVWLERVANFNGISDMNSKALEDYQMQLRLLKEQNRKAFGRRKSWCGTEQFQGWYDSLSWYERLRANWEAGALTPPWLSDWRGFDVRHWGL